MKKISKVALSAIVEKRKSKVEKKTSKRNKKQEVAPLNKGDIVNGKDGCKYVVTDPVKKTVKKLKSFSDLTVDDIEVGEASFITYQRYLKDRFNEDCPIKKGKLYFRDYRMKFDNEKGFIVEDIRDNYSIVDTPFEGIPTPRELGDWFDKPIKETSPEDMQKAKENGEKLVTPQVREAKVSIDDLREKVINKIEAIRKGVETKFDPLDFQQMIPNRKWRVNAGKIIKKWKERKIRYAKMLTMLEELVKDDTTFSDKPKKAIRTDFVGTSLPECKEVGILKGDKIEVDGKFIPAVPFIEKYILHYEPKVMPQLMKFASGEITFEELLENPIVKDNDVSYNSKLLKNTVENANILSCLCVVVGLYAPQDILFTDELKVGDKIKIFEDGEFKVRTITNTDFGICYGKGIGIMKFDKWYKILENKK